MAALPAGRHHVPFTKGCLLSAIAVTLPNRPIKVSQSKVLQQWRCSGCPYIPLHKHWPIAVPCIQLLLHVLLGFNSILHCDAPLSRGRLYCVFVAEGMPNSHTVNGPNVNSQLDVRQSFFTRAPLMVNQVHISKGSRQLVCLYRTC